MAIYGSSARGESDHLSDKDVLVVADEDYLVPLEVTPKLSISRYTWIEFERMASYGSLFLWHIRSESIPIDYSDSGIARFAEIMSSLNDYQLANRDLKSFRDSISDVENALESGDTSLEFEVAALATVIRHASILGCYKLNTPTFGRYSAVEVFCDARGLPSEMVIEFPHMYDFRLAVARNFVMPSSPTRVQVIQWVSLAKQLLQEVSAC